MYVVYMLKNSTNQKMYVGSTKNLSKRLYRHGLGNEKHLIAMAINSDGKNNFEAYILDSSEMREEILQKERQWILDLNSMHPNGYNLRAGQNEWHEDVKAKMSRSRTGYRMNDNSKNLLRNFHKKNMRPIRCIETGVVYESISDCSRRLKINKGCFSYFFRGITKSVNGLTFERIF